MIKSKFAIGSVYLTVLFLIGFLALGVFFLARPNMPMHNKFGATTGAWLPGLIIMGGGLLLYVLLKNTPVAASLCLHEKKMWRKSSPVMPFSVSMGSLR